MTGSCLPAGSLTPFLVEMLPLEREDIGSHVRNQIHALFNARLHICSRPTHY